MSIVIHATSNKKKGKGMKKDRQEQHCVQHTLLDIHNEEWSRWFFDTSDEMQEIGVFIRNDAMKDIVKFVNKDFSTWMLENRDRVPQNSDALKHYAMDRQVNLFNDLHDQFSHLFPAELGQIIEEEEVHKLQLWANIAGDVFKNLNAYYMKKAELEDFFGDDSDSVMDQSKTENEKQLVN